MSHLSVGEQAQVVGIGVAALIATSVGIWKTASLRGDVNARWAGRIAFARAALDDKTIRTLETLRSSLDEVLPFGAFDPGQAIADPGPLSEQAAEAATFYRTRQRMASALGILMQVGRGVLGALSLLALGICFATLDYAELWRGSAVRWIGLVLLALAALLLTALGGVYIALQERLASAERLAGTAGRTDNGNG